MAYPANRSIDFAPAWLKLPEATQDSKKQESTNNPPHQHSAHYSHRHSISHSDYHSAVDSTHYNQFQRSSSTSNPHHHSRSGGRTHIHSYRSGPSPNSQHPIQLQRSQSTGSYSDSIPARPTAANSNSVTPVAKPLEEEFPLLCSGPSTVSPGITQSQRTNQVNSTAQWRVKERAREDTGNKNPFNQQNDNLLTSNISGGKVYRAQVKPVKRTNMIPISNGNTTSNTTIKSRDNGEHNDYSQLSSSLDKEKRFLQELGWNEDEGSDDDCVIPEQDPAELEQIMMEAKLARQRLLMKNKQSMKAVPSAVLPNEDDLPSSSDNSDNE